MSDLADRLRHGDEQGWDESGSGLMGEAADRIEGQDKEIKYLYRHLKRLLDAGPADYGMVPVRMAADTVSSGETLWRESST